MLKIHDYFIINLQFLFVFVLQCIQRFFYVLDLTLMVVLNKNYAC